MKTEDKNSQQAFAATDALAIHSESSFNFLLDLFLEVSVLYVCWLCAVSGNLEAPHTVYGYLAASTMSGLPDDHFWPIHGSKTVFRAFGFES